MNWREHINVSGLMRFLWPFPSFGWKDLAFADKLKLFALYIQTGAAIIMTVFAAFAMWMLTGMRAIWPVFYMGVAAMGIIIVVVTGLASLLIKRSIEIEAGPLKVKSSDAEAAKQIISDNVVSSTIGEMTQVPPPPNG